MKKFATILILGTLISASSFATPPFTLADCKNPMNPDSGALLRGIGLSTGLTSCGLGSTSEGAATSSDISSSSSSAQRNFILYQGAQGANRIRHASTVEEMTQIYSEDSNVQMAFELLKREGFKGTLLDFANKAWEEIETK